MTHETPIFIHVDATRPTAIYQQIVDGVKRAVAAGTLGPGDALPSVRDLAVELRINLNTVARAYRMLQDQGLVAPRRGIGLFVAADVARAGRRERLALLDATVGALVAEARQLALSEEEVLGRVREAMRRDERVLTKAAKGQP